MLRLDFGDKVESFEEISWDEFSEKFDESIIRFPYDPDPKGFFSKFVADGKDE